MYNILLVEDDESSRLASQKVIRETLIGFNVKKAVRDGTEALAALKESDYDIVISDIKMPIMTGPELLTEVSKEYPFLIFIFLSNYEDFELQDWVASKVFLTI